MKVLLYEPGAGGHRSVILHYVQQEIERSGGTFVQAQPAEISSESLILCLKEIAHRNGCDLVHILTADDHIRDLVRASCLPMSKVPEVPVIVNYYLYSSFRHWVKGCVWDWIVSRGIVDRVLISDDFMGRRVLPSNRHAYLRYLPDPWDPDSFPLFDKNGAEAKVHLQPKRTRFLVFGDLGKRKGIDTIIAAYASIADTSTELLLVGRWDGNLAGSPTEIKLEQMVRNGSAILRNEFIPEELVSAYFCASDYVVCAYPKWFSVSSGTFTRACAAGKPVIVPAHGVVGELTALHRLGLTYETGSISSLANALLTAAATSKKLFHSPAAASVVATGRTVKKYGATLIAEYGDLLEWVKSRATPPVI